MTNSTARAVRISPMMRVNRRRLLSLIRATIRFGKEEAEVGDNQDYRGRQQDEEVFRQVLGPAGQDQGGGDGPGPGHQRHRQGHQGDIAVIVGLQTGGGVQAVEVAPALEHVKGDAEEDEAAGDLKGRQADARKSR